MKYLASVILSLLAVNAFAAPPSHKAGAHAKPKTTAASITAALSWVAPTTNVDGTPITGSLTYNVYQGAINAVTLVQSGITGTSVVISTGLTSGTTQCFAVVANEAGTASSESAETCKVIPVPTPPTETPSPPTRISLVLGTNNASPDKTVVTTVGPAITDATGNVWTLNAAGQVSVAAPNQSTLADTSTSNVIELAYVSGLVWQENASMLWWSKTAPSAQWLPQAGTSTAPL